MLDPIIESYFGAGNILSVVPLAQAGSDRKYTRVTLKDHRSYIVCHNEHVAENESFFYFSRLFGEKNIFVPEIIHVDDGRIVYIQEDLGNQNLLDSVMQQGATEEVSTLYKMALQQLVKMQIEAGNEIDFDQCFAAKSFDRFAVMGDLNYFKYYFADLHDITYNRQKLQLEFEKLSQSIEQISPQGFMFRDFQGRNIMIRDGEPYFIDYQGGMRGPLQYDVASLLWQAKAALPAELKENLYKYYKTALSSVLPIDEALFDQDYRQILLLRLMQVLGAYGFRGIIQQRQHFLSSIPFALQNIREWLDAYKDVISTYPELQHVLSEIVNEDLEKEYTIVQAVPDHKLKIRVQSFSYKNGIPVDDSGNGGGFVFDCRGILNPGRFEPFKKLTGRDAAVKEFLETKTRIVEFLAAAKKVIDISVEDYLARDFEHLMICFGCTGGQHRSVYCTDAIARHLKEKYNIAVDVKHLIQDEKNWVN